MGLPQAHWMVYFMEKSCKTDDLEVSPIFFKEILIWGRFKRDTLWLFNIAMENCPFIDGLPVNNGDFPWLCYITRWYMRFFCPINT